MADFSAERPLGEAVVQEAFQCTIDRNPRSLRPFSVHEKRKWAPKAPF